MLFRCCFSDSASRHIRNTVPASSLILACSLHYMTTWRHPENRKYITGEEDRATATITLTENWWHLDVWFLRYASGQTNKQTETKTNRHTHKHADHNTSQLYRRGSNKRRNVLRLWRGRPSRLSEDGSRRSSMSSWCPPLSETSAAAEATTAEATRRRRTPATTNRTTRMATDDVANRTTNTAPTTVSRDVNAIWWAM